MSCPKFRLAISDLSTVVKVVGVLSEARVADTMNSSLKKSLDSNPSSKEAAKGSSTDFLTVS